MCQKHTPPLGLGAFYELDKTPSGNTGFSLLGKSGYAKNLDLAPDEGQPQIQVGFHPGGTGYD